MTSLQPQMSNKPFTLNKQQIDDFFKTGYIVLEKVFHPEEIAEIGSCIDRLQEMAKSITSTQIYKGAQFVCEGERIDRIVWCGAAEPRLLDYGKDQRILTPVSQLLGSNSMQQLINQVHLKIPGDQVAFDWHQDSQHRGYGTADWKDINGRGSYVQTLLAVDPVTMNNGPVFFIPGSGHQGHLYLETKSNPGDFVNKSEAVPLLMSPGSLALFGPYVVHGSFPNNSSDKRRVLINGYAYPGANSKTYPGEGSGRWLEISSKYPR